MTQYERIRQEIIAVEKEIAMLRKTVRDEKTKEIFNNICTRNELIRDTFSEIKTILH